MRDLDPFFIEEIWQWFLILLPEGNCACHTSILGGSGYQIKMSGLLDGVNDESSISPDIFNY